MRARAAIVIGLFLGMAATPTSLGEPLGPSDPLEPGPHPASTAGERDPVPAQPPHAVDAILVFLASTGNGTELRYSFHGHAPALPDQDDVLAWSWFSGNPATPDLGNPSAVLAPTAQTKQVRVAWSREGYAVAVWDHETVYGNRTCPGPFDVPLFKSDIMFSVFRDAMGTWTAPAVGIAAPEDGVNHVRFDSASLAIDPSGRGVLVFANGTMDPCTGAGSRQIWNATWNGASLSFGTPQFLVGSALPPLGLLPTATAFSSRLSAAAARTRHHGIVAWYDLVGSATKTCVPPAPDPPFDITVPLYWPRYARWDGNGFVQVGDLIPGRRPPPGHWESYQIRFGLSASPDMLGNVTLAFTVLTTTDPCPGGPPPVAQAWQGRWNATGNTWVNATLVADGKAPAVAHRPDLPRDLGDVVYEGPDPPAFSDPPVNRSALSGNATGGDAQIGGAQGYNPTIAHLAHNRTVAVWHNGTNALFAWTRDGATGAAGSVAALGATGFLPSLAARTGSPGMPHAEWSYFGYFAADNNLHRPIANGDRGEIRSVGSTALVNAVLLTDPLNSWPVGAGWGAVPAPAPPAPFPDGNVRIEYLKENAHTELRDLGERNTATNATLEEYLRWALEHYPARRHILDLADHGEGWRKLCQDFRQGNDWLNMTELRSALVAVRGTSPFRWTVLAFSACMMGQLEVAYQVRDTARTMVASEELMPGAGPNYALVFNDLIASPFRADADAARRFVAHYQTAYAGGTGRGSLETLSAVDLSAIPAVATNANALGTALLNWITDAGANATVRAQRRAGITLQRNNSEEFPHNLFQTTYAREGYRDLHDFARRVNASLTPDDPGTALDDAVRTAAQNVMTSVQVSVLQNFADTGHPNARGLSVWLEHRSAAFTASRAQYLRTEFAAAFPAWVAFLGNQTGTRSTVLRMTSDSPFARLHVLEPGGGMTGIPTFEDTRCDTFCGTTIPDAWCEMSPNPGTVIVLPAGITTFTWYVNGTLLPLDANFTLTIQAVTLNETTGDLDVLYEETYGGPIAVGEVLSGEFPADAAPPTTTVSLDGTLGLNGWYVSPVTVTLNATDPDSGVASTSYRVDGGPWTTYVAPFVVSGDGVHDADYFSTDVVGNVEPIQTVAVRVDGTPPASGHAFAGTSGQGGWYVSPVTVTLSATDATSGVGTITYRLDGGPLQAYTVPFVVGDGTHTIEYFATDVAGNVEATRMASLRVDTGSPVTTATLAGTLGGAGWYTSAVTVTLLATDADSGVASIAYRVDGGPWTLYAAPFPVPGDGAHVVEYNATDTAGNVEPVRTTMFRIDTTAPATTASLAGTLGAGGWYVAPVTVTLSATDAASGVATIEYRVDGGAWTPYAGPFTISSEGAHLVEYRATDVAGNQEAMRSVALSVDTVAPVTTWTLAGTAGGGGWYVSPVTVTLSATDATSGVAAIEYRVDGGPWTPYGGPFVVGPGSHTVDVAGTDVAGNVEALRSFPVLVDTTPPATTATLAGTLGTGGWYRSAVTVTLAPTDAGSGVAGVEYRVGGGPFNPYTAPFTRGEGTHVVEYRATDVAGNVEAVQSVSFRVDATPPACTTSLSGTPGLAGWWRGDVAAMIACTDGGSGLGSLEFRVDGGAWTPYAGPAVTSGDGNHDLEFRAADAAGNVATGSETFRIDGTSPTVSVTSPQGGAVLNVTSVLVTWAVSDASSGVGTCTVALDGGAPADVGNATSTQLTGLGAGSHTVSLRCTDVAGNEGGAAVTFTVTLPTTPPEATPFPLLAGLGLAVLALALLGLLFLRRRRRGGGEPEEADEDAPEPTEEPAEGLEEDELEL